MKFLRERKSQEKGLGVIGAIALIPVLLIVAAIAWYAYCEARKAYWDGQVEEMCKKDGGATVYKKIALSPEELSKTKDIFGHLSIPNRSKAQPDSIVISEMEDTYLRRSNPEVRRSEFHLIRKSNEALLAKQVIYSRVGGDFPSPAHDSSFSCLDIANAIGKTFDVEQLTIELPGEQK